MAALEVHNNTLYTHDGVPFVTAHDFTEEGVSLRGNNYPTVSSDMLWWWHTAYTDIESWRHSSGL